MVIRGKVLVGKADRVNANAPAVKGQSDEDAREKELHGVGRTESTKGPGTSTMQSTFRLGGDRVRSSLEAPTSDQRKVHDSPEKGKWTIGDAQKSASLRSGAELQGAQTATLDSDKSARKVDDRVVTGGFLRPMATDGKGEEDSPRMKSQNLSRTNTQYSSKINMQNLTSSTREGRQVELDVLSDERNRYHAERGTQGRCEACGADHAIEQCQMVQTMMRMQPAGARCGSCSEQHPTLLCQFFKGNKNADRYNDRRVSTHRVADSDEEERRSEASSRSQREQSGPGSNRIIRDEERASQRRSSDQREAEQRSYDQRASEQGSWDQRASDRRASEQRSSDQRESERRAADQKAREREDQRRTDQREKESQEG